MSTLLGMPWQDILPWLAVIVALLTLPWVALIIVYVGGLIQLSKTRSLNDKLLDSIDKALERAQTAAHGPAPVPAPVPPPTPAPAQTPAPAPPAQPPQTAPPAPAAPYANAPWVNLALHEIGFHETGNNQGISRYIAMAHCGAEGDPWCAIFANAMLEQAGVPGTKSPSSQSFRTDPNFIPLSQPARGAIVVYWRISKASGQGHVGFYWGEDSAHVWTLGGNENDMVQIEALPKDSSSFGLIGYWWPKGVPLPKGGPVMMPAGSPVSIQATPAVASAPTSAPANGVQTNITATVFGGQTSAYGPPINDNSPGVALPYRFSSPRPRVRVMNASTNASVDCDIVDIGPWNINDPYWQTGARPQAESGTDLGQTGKVRQTNKAGIDLTAAAAKAVGVDGKGLVSWSFIDDPSSPKVS
ncbi:hypothetical protein [Bradyrhizobium sp. Tv2a-2]|uniref:hypothetical protein n=1 Tax=Bradyrhizobium sp. Tv2a-2 TaxID=113395 RepID=UPI0003F6DA56|nr:hypothetical protein [Bradyrhizobium sp. Tv2a-2]